MKAISIFNLIVIFIFTASSRATEKANIEKTSLKDLTQKEFQTDSDIKDMELKAQAGAQKRWSLKASLSYFGPSLAEPLSDKKRNPDGRFTDVRTSLGGSLGLRYRRNKKSAINLGAGVSAVKPFHGAEQIDAQDPFISIDRTGNVGGLQTYSYISGAFTTTEFYRDIEQVGSIALSQTARYFVPKTAWTLGFNTSLSFFLYERSFSKQNFHVGSNYFLGAYPFAAYRFNDKWMINTSSAFQAANQRFQKDWMIWKPNNVTQRLGLGWGATREIYFSPYVTFFWKDPTWTTSTFSFSTIFSVF